MSKVTESLNNIRYLDDLARKKTSIHKLHPITKLLTTVVFLTVVVSFGKHDIINLLVFVFYPIMIMTFAEIPTIPLLKRFAVLLPFVVGIGILNPLLEHQTFVFKGVELSIGWITFFTIILKSFLTIISALLLVSTTGMDKLALALRILKIPKLFVLQIVLTYRYLSVLMEELSRMLRSYALRAPGSKGIQSSAWGSFAGQLLLRTFDRAQRVYQAMCIRGFNGDYNTGEQARIKAWDIVYICIWSVFFIVARIYNIPMIIGRLLTGVIG